MTDFSIAGADRTLEFTLVVPIPPMGQQRPRHDGRSGRMHTPTKTIRYIAAIREAVMVEWKNRDPLEGPLALHVRHFFPLPKQSKGRKFHTQRPDGSNCYKAVEDALLPLRKKERGVWVTKWQGVYRDDALIVDGRFYKEWAPPDDPGAIAFKLWSLS